MKKILCYILIITSIYIYIYIYIYEANKNSDKYLNFSVDDVIIPFKDITENEHTYDSIFDNETFAYLKYLHEEYNVKVTCYIFLEEPYTNFSLFECTDKFKQEFINNSDWLKIGFHSRFGEKTYAMTTNAESFQDYNELTNEVIRIAGEESLEKVVRLQAFAGNTDSLNAMINSDEGILGVLSADDNRISYNLDNFENNLLFNNEIMYKNNLIYFKTDLRIENITNIREAVNINNDPFWIIFTHERYLYDNEKRKILEAVLKYASANNYKNVFLSECAIAKKLLYSTNYHN